MPPDAGPNHYARGCLLREQKRNDLAASEFRAAMASDPDDPHAPAMLALTLTDLEKPNQALSVAREAVRRGPDEPFAFIALGYAQWACEKVEAATRAARDALRLDARNVNALVLLAQLAEVRMDWHLALDYSDSALQINPTEARAVVQRANALLSLGRVDQAVECLRRMLRSIPESGRIHEALGLALLHAGQESEALPHFKEALRLDPSAKRTRAYLAEAMKSRSQIYRLGLQIALWFSRRKELKSTAVVIIITLYLVAMMISASRWRSALPWWTAGIGLGLAALMYRRLSIALFDLLLQFDPFGRHLLSSKQRYAAWTVGIFFAVALLASIAAVFEPIFLMVAIPNATIFPWSIHRAMSSMPAGYTWLRLTYLIGGSSINTGLFAVAIADAFRLSEIVFGVGFFLIGTPLMIFGGVWIAEFLETP